VREFLLVALMFWVGSVCAAPAPLHIASGCRLRSDVPAGKIVKVEDMEPIDDSPLWKLRREQDAIFLGKRSASQKAFHPCPRA